MSYGVNILAASMRDFSMGTGRWSASGEASQDRQGTRPRSATDAARPCRGGDRIASLFTALHDSGYGTKLLNARALVCPEELAKADMRPFRRDSAFDP
jgi:hypothetical protein